MARIGQYNVDRTQNPTSVVFVVTDPGLPGYEGVAQIDLTNGHLLGAGYSEPPVRARLHVIAMLHAIQERGLAAQ